MRLTVGILLIATICSAADVKPSRNKQKLEDFRTDKRASIEGNVNAEKRAPGIQTVPSSVTPGIEYADSKDVQRTADQQIYATSAPQIAKFSDVLTGQGPPFQAAIASHLYSPISVYQPRLGTPTTYEVSAPVPSQLAYSEHKIAYQPQQNSIQYTPQEYRQPLANAKEAIAKLTVNYQPGNQIPYHQQQVLLQTQPSVYTQQQSPQQIYQQISQNQGHQIVYTQNQIQQPQSVQVYAQNQVQQPQSQEALVQLEQRPEILYAQKEVEIQRPAGRELKSAPVVQFKITENKQNYNIQPQTPINFGNFAQNQQAEIQHQQYQVQEAHVQAQQYQALPQQQHLQAQYQPQHYQIQANYHAVQYQPQAQYVVSKPEFAADIIGPAKVVSTNPSRQLAYFRQGPNLQLFQHQPQAQPSNQVQQEYAAQHLAVAPTFPPVQYFGKFAHSIFGGHQHK